MLILCLLATGCVRTTHPVLKDEQVVSNDALLGKWVSDDGKVSVERTKLAGMTDWLAIPAIHPFIMRNKTVMAQTLAFLRTGKFDQH